MFHVKKAEYVTAFPSLDHVYETGSRSTDVEVKDTCTAVQTDTTMDNISSMSDEIKQLKAKLNYKSTLFRKAFTETVTKNDEMLGCKQAYHHWHCCLVSLIF